MRVSLVQNLESRDGTVGGEEYLGNILIEQSDVGVFAVLRPGLSNITTSSGAGAGLYQLVEDLIVVFGTTISFGEGLTPITTVTSGTYDFACGVT